jgi:hypothetical protein
MKRFGFDDNVILTLPVVHEGYEFPATILPHLKKDNEHPYMFEV